jgi:hypothetical protein
MSRSGYNDDWDCDNWSTIIWRGAVASAFRGKRGQDFLKRLAAHLDAMPVKRLAAHDWTREDGVSCTLGVALAAEKPELHEKSKAWDPDDDEAAYDAARALDIAPAMAKELIWMNDEGLNYQIRPYRFIGPVDRDAERWKRVREWVQSRIRGA